jgi:hypothetical protein
MPTFSVGGSFRFSLISRAYKHHYHPGQAYALCKFALLAHSLSADNSPRCLSPPRYETKRNALFNLSWSDFRDTRPPQRGRATPGWLAAEKRAPPRPGAAESGSRSLIRRGDGNGGRRSGARADAASQAQETQRDEDQWAGRGLGTPIRAPTAEAAVDARAGQERPHPVAPGPIRLGAAAPLPT